MSNTSVNANYTPTMAELPWKIGTESHVYDANGHFVTVSGFHFTVTGGYYIPSRLNTEYIVRACNAHEQLVAALKMALEIGDGCSRGFLGKFQAVANAALAAAEA